MPLNVQAFDEIEIGTSEMNFDDVEISEELESSSEDIESKDDEADVEAEADIEENMMIPTIPITVMITLLRNSLPYCILSIT